MRKLLFIIFFFAFYSPISDALGQSAETMQATAQAFRAAVASTESMLVTIESYGGVGTKQGKIGGIRKQGEGNTTGVLLGPDGFIITSTFNFLTQPLIITVVTSDGVRRVARPMGRDDSRKICLLKIEDTTDLPDVSDIERVNVGDLRVGQWALSLGVGYGDKSPAVSMGIISALNRIGGRAVQTDANISPANYGGPLIDIQGRLIGICVPLNPQSSAVAAGVEWYDSGIGFAIPLTQADTLIERLKDPETRIHPAFLGVRSTPNTEGEGMFIESVVPGSAAENAGLEAQDIILELNEKNVSDMLTLKQILNRFESGTETQIKFLRTTSRSDDEQEEREEVQQPKEITATVRFLPPPKPKEDVDLLEPPKIR